jgi:hypothetical protein
MKNKNKLYSLSMCANPLLIFIVMIFYILMGEMKMNSCLAAEALETHGTLNVILANEKCLVIASDSRLTSMRSTGPVFSDNYMKVFQLPGNTIITVAGYYSGGLKEVPGVIYSIDAIVDNYINEVKRKNFEPRHIDVVRSILRTVTFYLNSLSAIEAATAGFDNSVYETHLMFAGLEGNKVSVTKVILRCQKNAQGRLNYEVSNVDGLITKGDLYYQLGGWDVLAKDILENPAKYERLNIDIINNYSTMARTNSLKDMTCSQAESLAKSIIVLSSEVNPTIGGPIHSASIVGDKISLNIPPGAKKISYKSPFKFLLQQDVAISNEPFDAIAFPKGTTIKLVVDGYYQNSKVDTDHVYFFNTKFNNSVIEVRTDLFYFADNIKVENTSLIIYDGVNKESKQLKALIANHKWSNILYRK